MALFETLRDKHIKNAAKDILEKDEELIGACDGYLSTITSAGLGLILTFFTFGLIKTPKVFIIVTNKRIIFRLYRLINLKIIKTISYKWEKIIQLEKTFPGTNNLFDYKMTTKDETHWFSIASGTYTIKEQKENTKRIQEFLVSRFLNLRIKTIIRHVCNHFWSIGFPISTSKDVENVTEVIFEKAMMVKTKMVNYKVFKDISDAEMYYQIDNDGKILIVNPHFKGKSRFHVGLVEHIENDEKSMNGSFYAWASPLNPHDPESGLYPFVFDVPDFHTLNIKLPTIAEVQITAFAHYLHIFKDETDFHYQQEKYKTNFAANYFIPSGLFRPDGEKIVPPQAIALFAGTVKESEILTNWTTNIQFIHLIVEIYGGELDIVVDRQIIKTVPKPGQIVSGEFWLSGRILKVE